MSDGKLIDFDAYLDGMVAAAWEIFIADKKPTVAEGPMKQLIREEFMRESAKRAILSITNAYEWAGYHYGRDQMVSPYLVDKDDNS
ncbi:MAG: hypothetical protein IT337_01920 [Thermomicrobiales bacterium]|nr:hypothetical protein [Thermomicrobiales bacterium]